MSVFRSIPAIQIDAPVALIGRRFDVAVSLHANEETRLRHVDVRLFCKQGWFDSGAFHHILRPDITNRILERAVLPAGVTQVNTGFDLPSEMPPSHRFQPAFSFAELSVRVAIWPWRSGSHTITPILQLPVDDGSRTPIVTRTSESGEFRLEVSLASTRLVAGETVHGRCAVFGLDDAAPREIRFQFVPTLSLHGKYGHPVTNWGVILGTTVTLPAGTGGTSVPFQLDVPADATPSFAAITHRLSRELVVTTGAGAEPQLGLQIPIQILDRSATTRMARMHKPPPLSDERIADVFAGFASSNGWHRAAAEHGRGHAIERSVEGCMLRLAIEYRGKLGAVLVARARYHSFGLGLVVSPNTVLQTVMRDDFDVGIPAWDRTRHVAGRSPDQVVPVLLTVVPVIVLAELGALAHWDDHEIVFERPAISLEHAGFAALDRGLTRVAAAIAEARDAIPPPQGVVDFEGWRGLARELHGELNSGDLAIDGSIGRLPARIRVRWQAVRPTHVEIAIGSEDTASDEVRRVAIAVARPATETTGDPATRRLLGLHAWSTDVEALRIADGVATATIVLSEATITSERARELIKALHRVRTALDPETGPYR